MYFDLIARFGIGIVLAAIAALLQGCLAAAWVAAVGVGSSVNGSVEFEPFENTWVASRDQRTLPRGVTRVAIVPFAGDDAMGTRFSVAFERASRFTVVGPDQLSRQRYLSPSPGETSTPGGWDQLRMARKIASKLAVDCVLFGRVVKGQVHRDAWGNKEISSHRLLITMRDASGQALWTDELPYRVAIGAQPFPEAWIQDELTTHLAAHTLAIGLAQLAPQGDQPKTPAQPPATVAPAF